MPPLRLLVTLLLASDAATAVQLRQSQLQAVGQAEPALVHAVLCHSNVSDVHAQFVISRLRSVGYVVVLPNCTDAFSKRFVSAKTGNAYNSWGGRLAKYRDALESLPDHALAMLLDVSDVLVMGSAAEAAHRFHAFGTPLVASCTGAMWPPPEDCPAYATLPSPFASGTACRFPCAGAFMGTTLALRELFAGAAGSSGDVEAWPPNDQCWLHERLAAWPAAVAGQGVGSPVGNWTLDTGGQLFLDANRAPPGTLRPHAGRFEVSGGGPQPTIIHMPGLHPSGAAVRELYALAAQTAPAT